MRCWPFVLLLSILLINGRALSQQATATKALHELFQKRMQERLEQFKFHWYLMDFNQREGPQTSDDLASGLRFETLKDYQDWLARLDAFPAYLDQVTTLLRQGIRERMVHPKIIMQRIPAQIEKQ